MSKIIKDDFIEIPKDSRFTYIIGNNGVGKSLTLESNAQINSYKHDVIVISSGVSDKFKWGGAKKVRKPGSYTYLGNRTVGNGIHINTISANAVLNYVSCLKSQSENDFFELLKKIGFEPVVEIAPRNVKKRKDVDVEEFKGGELNHEFVNDHSRVFLNKSKPFELMLKKEGCELMSFSSFSSGEQNMISMGLKILSQRSPEALFYIDEPEISLHLEWQLAWPKLMQGLVGGFPECKFVVATHSPVIIASALALKARCFNLGPNKKLSKIDSNNPNIEGLIFGEFHTYTPGNKAIYEQYARVLSMALEYTNAESYSKEEVEGEVKNLVEKARKVSILFHDKKELNISIKEFEGAIKELLLRSVEEEHDV